MNDIYRCIYEVQLNFVVILKYRRFIKNVEFEKINGFFNQINYKNLIIIKRYNKR